MFSLDFIIRTDIFHWFAFSPQIIAQCWKKILKELE